MDLLRTESEAEDVPQKAHRPLRSLKVWQGKQKPIVKKHVTKASFNRQRVIQVD